MVRLVGRGVDPCIRLAVVERQKGRKAERQKGRKAERQKGRKAERQKVRRVEGLKGRLAVFNASLYSFMGDAFVRGVKTRID